MVDKGKRDIDNTELININRQWLEQKYRDLKGREKEIKHLAEECKMIRLEMDPLEKWLVQMEGPGAVDELHRKFTESAPEAAKENLVCPDEINGEQQFTEIRGSRLRDEVVKLLQAVYPGMMYYREILEHLTNRGYKVGGKDPGLNLIAHISTDKRIARGEKRGIYGLSDHFIQQMEAGKDEARFPGR